MQRVIYMAPLSYCMETYAVAEEEGGVGIAAGGRAQHRAAARGMRRCAAPLLALAATSALGRSRWLVQICR